MPLTALQSGVCLRSRVTLTAFSISRTTAAASSSARLRVQSFVFILNFLNFLKFPIVYHALPHAHGFAVKLPIIHIITYLFYFSNEKKYILTVLSAKKTVLSAMGMTATEHFRQLMTVLNSGCCLRSCKRERTSQTSQPARFFYSICR